MHHMRRSAKLGKMVGAAEREQRAIVATNENDRKRLERAYDAGKLVCPMRQLYARPEYWASLDTEECALHVMRALQLIHPSWVFASTSAALAHGLWVARSHVWPIRVATDRRSHTRSSNGLLRQFVEGDEPVEAGDLHATSLLRTTIDCLREMDFPNGLAVADSALRTGSFTKGELIAAIEDLSVRCAGRKHALATALHADARSESGGESVMRARVMLLGYEPPELQIKLPNLVDEEEQYRSDFGWKIADGTVVLGEMDGMEKYENKAMTGGRDATRVFADERLRESRVSATGARVMRFSYADMMNDQRFCKIMDVYGIPKAAHPAYEDHGRAYLPAGLEWV